MSRICLKSRIEELRKISDKKDIPLEEKSLEHLQAFFKKLKCSVRPSLFLLENGNFRLLWSENGEQIGLQFLKNSMIQFVIMLEKDKRSGLFRGIDTHENTLKIIKATGLDRLLSPPSSV